MSSEVGTSRRTPGGASTSGTLGGAAGGGATGGRKPAGPPGSRANDKLYHTSRTITGTANDVARQLKYLTADIKADAKGKYDYEHHRKRLMKERAELAARVDENEAWVTHMEAGVGAQDSLENQYKALVATIERIYAGAKEFHSAPPPAPPPPPSAPPRATHPAPRPPPVPQQRRARLLSLLCCRRCVLATCGRPAACLFAHARLSLIFTPPPLRPPGTGIGLLIKDFNYHVTYKRWNDTFSASAFVPK